MPERSTLQNNTALQVEAEKPDNLHSAIYQGWVWHHRYLPKSHKFRYRVFMMYLELTEIDSVLSLSKFWGRHWYHLARFKRSDYFSIDSDYAQNIDTAVKQEVKRQLGFDVTGSICLLTNLKYFGYITNPISCYYCFNADNSQLQALLIEVTNTPWGERHHYVLDLRKHGVSRAVEFEKKMHVSPFMPMDRNYRWQGEMPAQKLRYTLASLVMGDAASSKTGSSAQSIENQKHFDSGVVFDRQAINAKALNSVLLRFPFMTLKVLSAIYWQALKIWLKKIPFVPHPNAKANTSQ